MHAPLLFVSSNPSISLTEDYPRGDWSDDAITDYFIQRFQGGRKHWMQDGTKTLQHDGTYTHAIAFWAAVRQRASELLERDPHPGVDYALTEIVHCKSRAERGVIAAQKHCVGRYLQRVLELAGARVIVVLGTPARRTIQQLLAIPEKAAIYGPTSTWGNERYLAFLPHPNAHAKRTFSACLSSAELQHLRAVLRYES